MGEKVDKIHIGDIIRPISYPNCEWLVVDIADNDFIEDCTVRLLALKLSAREKVNKVGDELQVTLSAIFSNGPYLVRRATKAEMVLYGQI